MKRVVWFGLVGLKWGLIAIGGALAVVLVSFLVMEFVRHLLTANSGQWRDFRDGVFGFILLFSIIGVIGVLILAIYEGFVRAKRWSES